MQGLSALDDRPARRQGEQVVNNMGNLLNRLGGGGNSALRMEIVGHISEGVRPQFLQRELGIPIEYAKAAKRAMRDHSTTSDSHGADTASLLDQQYPKGTSRPGSSYVNQAGFATEILKHFETLTTQTSTMSNMSKTVILDLSSNELEAEFYARAPQLYRRYAMRVGECGWSKQVVKGSDAGNGPMPLTKLEANVRAALWQVESPEFDPDKEYRVRKQVSLRRLAFRYFQRKAERQGLELSKEEEEQCMSGEHNLLQQLGVELPDFAVDKYSIAGPTFVTARLEPLTADRFDPSQHEIRPP